MIGLDLCVIIHCANIGKGVSRDSCIAFIAGY